MRLELKKWKRILRLKKDKLLRKMNKQLKKYIGQNKNF